jgi:DNA-binding PadR family transcriptional regulator
MPNRDLLAEYGLWDGAYDTLVALRDGGPLTWPHPTLDATSGNPAKALRKFVDLGLLTGPARGQKIDAALFAITRAGLDVLRRVERGLHSPTWLTQSKLRALECLVRRGGSALRSALTKAPDKVHSGALSVLIGAGYVEARDAPEGEIVCITDLGREAYEEARRPGQE